jgi:thiamine-phosphate pyrophosphorylase
VIPRTSPVEVRLIAITDFERVGVEATLARAERLGRAALPGSVAFQLRDRSLGGRALHAIGARLGAVARAAGQALIVNDRLDIALLLDADALHLGENSVDTAAARRLWPRAIFRACHDPERALVLDADAIMLAPVMAPRKQNPALGAEGVRRTRALLARASRGARLFALGGVTAENAGACFEAGADGVAAIGAAFDADEASPLLEALAITRAPRRLAP